ncbi:MAG: hypothetical protein PVH25_02445 [Burkholderiales bacterium]|jgi:hypothetical protein
MRKIVGFMLVLSLATLWGCSHTRLVTVPPRIDLKNVGTLGVVEFTSNASPDINAQATREFQEYIHAAQPGTRLIELGSPAKVKSAVGAGEFNADALRKIGEKYGVDAIFLSEISYSDPETSVKVTDISKLEGGVRTIVRGDMSSKLLETRSGASIWSSGSWATERVGGLSVSAEDGVDGGVRTPRPRERMVSAMLYHLTEDFRPTQVREKVE